jgi:hypothetical protein
MIYGRARFANHKPALDGAVVNHLAELVRGKLLQLQQGPLIRPSGTFSPRGEGTLRYSQQGLLKLGQPRALVEANR